MSSNWKRYKDSNYAFSDKGEVFNLKTEKYRNIYNKENLHLHLNGKEKRITISRVVYQLFIGQIPNKFYVAHKDGNSFNNSIENLYLEEKRKLHSRYCNKRKVRCLETNHVFNTVLECSQQIHYSYTGLIRHLSQNRPNNISNKHYVYEDDYQESIS